MFTIENSKYIIRQARLSDCDAIASRLRKIDAEELRLSHGVEALDGLKESYNLSKIALTAETPEGRPEVMFGVSYTMTPRVGGAWLLGTDFVSDISLSFVKDSKRIIDFFQLDHDLLYNWIYAKNTSSLKWLKAIGFENIGKNKNYQNRGGVFINMARFSSNKNRALYLDFSNDPKEWEAYNKDNWAKYTKK